MFRRTKQKKEGSSLPESSSFENITGSNDLENKRNFKLFKFSKKNRDKSNHDFELPESPDSDGIRIDEAFQKSNDSQEEYFHQGNTFNEKSSESKINSSKLSLNFSHKPPSTHSPTHSHAKSPTFSPPLSHLFSPTLNSPSSSIKSTFDREINPESAEDDTTSYSSQSNMSNVSATDNKAVSPDLNEPVFKSSYSSNESRTINVNRTKAGDFGIVLRRSSSVRKGDKRMIHLVEPGANSSNVGLLPGDHLIALNGVNVENVSRKDIIGMIASSANTITLTVAPIAEYAEHVTKLAVKQNNNSFTASVPSIPRLETSYSISCNKKNISVKEPLSENLLNGEMVWLVHDNGYSAGQVYKETNVSNGLKKYCIQLNDGTEIIDVDENLIEQMNPVFFNQCEKLSSLQYLNESSCLHTLQQRYAAKLIHTFADNSLIIIKPKEKIDHYSDKFMQMIHDCKQEAMPPHIFSVAQSAYRSMVATNTNQSILFWGSAGSGKSFNVNNVVKYLCKTILKGSLLTVSKIEAAMFLIDTFGCVKTDLSSNATTIRYLITFEFNSSGFMIGCNMQNMFLGKSFFSTEGSTYHIFYHLLFNCKGKLKADLLLDALPKSSNLLINLAGGPEHLEDWNYLYSLFEILNFSDNEILGIFAPLAAILHIGAAGISNVSDTNFYFSDSASASRAASVLGTTVENLEKIIFILPMQRHPSFVERNSGADNFASLSGSTSFSDNSTYDTLLYALEAFCYGLYVESFNALFRMINRALNTYNRVVSKINILDMPGLQDQSLVGKSSNFMDFCINYCCEKLQWFSYRNRFAQQVERYNRENIDCSFEINSIISPIVTISALEKLASDHISSKNSIYDEKLFLKEGVLSNVGEPTIAKNLRSSFYESVVTTQLPTESFVVLHYQNTIQVKYNIVCFKRVREHSSVKLAYGALNDSSKTHVTELYAGHISGVTQLSSVGSFANRRHLTNQIATSVKNSTILQLKLQMDKLLDLLEVSCVSFVFCLLPEKNAGVLNPYNNLDDGKVKEAQTFDVPFLRQQLRSCQLLESMRLYRQGYPEHITYPEFRQRFSILLQKEDQDFGVVLDEKQAVLKMVTKLDLNEKSYKLGLSQIFFRAGCLTRLEDARNDHLSIIISEFQSHCKGFLARIKFKKLVLQNVAIRCIQRNVRKYMSIRSWAWWRLFTKVLPLLQVHRTDEELQTKNSQIIKLNSKIEHLQEINNNYEVENTRLKKKILDLTTELNEASSAASGANEIISFNSVENVKLEEKLNELKIEIESLRKQKELQQEQMLSTNVLSLNESGSENENFWQEKYKALSQSCESVKRLLIEEHEKEVEELTTQKRNAEKALYEVQSNYEEIQEQMITMKQKLQKLNGNLEDIKLLLENEQIKNVELEKRHKKFDQEIMKAKEEMFQERRQKEDIQKEHEMLNAEMYSLQRSTALKEEENEELKRKLESFSYDVDSSHNTDELTTLKKKISENELKIQDLEDEVDEQAGVIQQLEQTKTRLQMQNYNEKQKFQQDLESKEEEITQLRSDHLKKVRVLEEQLEEETSLKCELQRAKRELEKVVIQFQNSSNLDVEKKLKKKLKKTQILYNDAKTALDNLSIKSSELIELKALRNQLEDCEYTKNMALKAKSQVENDLKNLRDHVENLNQSKTGLEEKCSLLARENAELLQRMEESDDGLEEMIRNNKSLISQVSDSQKIIINLKEDYRILMEEKTSLSRTVDILSQKIELELSSKVSKVELDKAEMKFRESENKLELETAIRIKAEHQVLRLKGQLEKLQDECDQVNKNLSRTQQSFTRVERQFNEMRNELEASKIQESEYKRKKEDLEKRLEIVEDELSRKKIEVTNTEKRVRELKEFIDSTNSSDEDFSCDDTDYI
ncbi:unconventional myosin-XVIIIa isoform X2 [Hydra vulgaris]|uniref:Unconventional myosin-XVIIIa isoform X2 n=1 Tax=Hydra vulgaris TaxID=6087 RepID=A0ABM4CNL5_HYDVU